MVQLSLMYEYEVGTTGQEQGRKAIGLLDFRKEENSTSHTYV